MSIRRRVATHAGPRSASAGVTLLELLVVLAIMAIAAAFVYPMFGGSGASTGELKSAARQVAAGLRSARNEALASRKETRLVLDLEQRTFRIDRDAYVHPLPKMIEVKLFTAQSDLVNDRVGAIRFFADGGSNGGRVTLVSGARKYDVDVDWLTGRVAILD
jgi:general secretion pathway protein H